MSEDEMLEKPKKAVKSRKSEDAVAPSAELPSTGIKQKKSSKRGFKEGFYAVGRRKTSVARIRLVKGDGVITINGRGYEDYVAQRHNLITEILKPFLATNLNRLYSVEIKANGGGVASQAGAVKLGIARALIMMDPELKSQLSKAGCLVRDPRMKERKKYGRKRARKRFQYSKR
jgi:small subunit ribosomal protein S9